MVDVRGMNQALGNKEQSIDAKVPHGLPTFAPVLNGALNRSLPLSPHMRACVWMVSRIVSHCPLHMCACVGFPRPCLAVPPIVSHGLPACVHVLDGVSPFPRSPLVSPCPPFCPIVSAHACLCWILRPPSGGLVPLVSHFLPLSPHMCVPVLDGMVCPPSCDVLVFPCLPLSRIVCHCLPLWHMCACVGRCVRLPEVLSPHCLPVYVCLCWMVCLPSQVLVFPCLSMPTIALIVSHCLPTCVPVLDGVFVFGRCACVGWCVRIPELLCPLASQLVSHCLPTCVHVLDDVPAFPRSCPCLPLPTHVFPCLAFSPFLFSFVGWCVRLPEVLSSLVCHCCMVRPHS